MQPKAPDTLKKPNDEKRVHMYEDEWLAGYQLLIFNRPKMVALIDLF
jgi:hypothetical protein